MSFIRPNLNEMAGLDHIFGYSALIPGDYSDLLQTNEIGDNPWRETMANNAILSLLNTRFIFATQEQWKSLQNILAEASPATSDAARPGSGRENLLSPAAWIALSGSPANLDAPFACSELPCGMKQPGLLLEKDSVYQLALRGAERGQGQSPPGCVVHESGALAAARNVQRQ